MLKLFGDEESADVVFEVSQDDSSAGENTRKRGRTSHVKLYAHKFILKHCASNIYALCGLAEEKENGENKGEEDEQSDDEVDYDDIMEVDGAKKKKKGKKEEKTTNPSSRPRTPRPPPTEGPRSSGSDSWRKPRWTPMDTCAQRL
ncbi:hypothetical protein ACHAWF_018877 [Thalassiosira exigua]